MTMMEDRLAPIPIGYVHRERQAGIGTGCSGSSIFSAAGAPW